MASEKVRSSQLRLVRELRRARKRTRKAEARLQAASAECDRSADECRRARERLDAAADGLSEVVASLQAATVELRAITTVRTTDPRTEVGAARDADPRLEHVLLAQRRTNELLELALGVAFDADLE